MAKCSWGVPWSAVFPGVVFGVLRDISQVQKVRWRLLWQLASCCPQTLRRVSQDTLWHFNCFCKQDFICRKRKHNAIIYQWPRFSRAVSKRELRGRRRPRLPLTKPSLHQFDFQRVVGIFETFSALVCFRSANFPHWFWQGKTESNGSTNILDCV